MWSVIGDVSVAEGAVLILLPARRVPPKVLPLLKQELDQLVKKDIIRPISEPADWCSTIVIAYKKMAQYDVVLISEILISS